MKTRSRLITVCIGLIIVSISMLIKEPAYGIANIGVFCTFMKKAAPVLIVVSSILIMLAATKLRRLSIAGVILITGSIVATYFLAENTGYAMGTTGWVSGFVSILFIVPAGLLLCCISGLLSLIDMMEKESAVKKPVITSALAILILGLAYHVAADWKPDVHTLVEAVKSGANEYERVSIAGKLWEIKDDTLPPMLLPLLEDENPRVREAAATALGGESRNAAMARPLIRALDREADEKTRERIIRSLATVVPMAEEPDRTRAVEMLIQILKTGEGTIKGTAADALGMIRDERAIQPLIDALADKDTNFYAHNALITITGKRLERDPDAWNHWMAGQNDDRRTSE